MFVIGSVLLWTSLTIRTNAKNTPGVSRTPLMGWNTWCTQNDCTQDWCTSSEILDVAWTIKDLGMLDLGWNHIDLDDCFGARNPVTHQFEGVAERFPEGMPAFIAKLKAMGFSSGIYTDWGETACHPQFAGSWPYYQQDAATFAKWNVSVIKFDGCDAPAGYTPEQLTANFSQALADTGAPIWLYFHCWYTESCATYGNSFRVFTDHHDNWPSTVSVIKFLQYNRTGYWGPGSNQGFPDPDFVFTGGAGCGNFSGPGVRCPGQTDTEYLSEFAVWAVAGGQLIFATDPRNITDFMKGVLMNKEVIAVFRDTQYFDKIAVLPYAPHDRSRGEATDTSQQSGIATVCNVTMWHQQSRKAQCIEGQTYGCYAGEEAMWTEGGCQGIFYCDNISMDCGDEDDKTRHNCSCAKPPIAAWVRPLSGSDDGCVAVVLLNPSEAAAEVGVQLSALPVVSWGANTRVTVRDLWSHSDEDPVTGRYKKASVPPHGNAFVKLCKQ